MGNRAESQDLIDLGNRIRKRRQEIHLSQEVLAEKTGISPNTISRIEGGQTAMSIEIFRKLAVILIRRRVSFTKCLCGIEQKSSPVSRRLLRPAWDGTAF